MSSSIQSDGWLRVSLVFMARRRADRVSLPLLSSSTRESARDGLDEVEGGGSGPDGGGGEVSGEEVGRLGSEDEAVSGNQLGFTKSPSKG